MQVEKFSVFGLFFGLFIRVTWDDLFIQTLVTTKISFQIELIV